MFCNRLIRTKKMYINAKACEIQKCITRLPMENLITVVMAVMSCVEPSLFIELFNCEYLICISKKKKKKTFILVQSPCT